MRLLLIRNRGALRWGALVAAAVIVAACTPVAVEGTDATFGKDGLVSTVVAGGSGEEVHDLAVQPNNKIVAVGYIGCYQCESSAGIVRYNADGSPDTSFDGDGRQTLKWLDCCSADATSVAVQTDGKVVVGGGVHFCCVLTNDLPGLARFNVDGTLDTSFGTGGKVTTGLPGPVSSYITDIALQPDGKIVAVAYTGDLHQSESHLAVLRYLANGDLDTTFGNQGIASPTLTGAPRCELSSGLAVQADGRIVVGGSGRYCDGSSASAIMRLLPTGQPDQSFGTGGGLIVPNDVDVVNDLALQPDGKIVVAGNALARFTTTGALDTAFGGTGIVRRQGSPISGGIALAIRASDGMIITANSDGSDTGLLVVQWHPDGTYETPTFARIGGSSAAYAVAVGPDGKVVAGGYDYQPKDSQSQFAIARYPAQRTTPTILRPSGHQVPKPVEAYAPHVFLASGEQYTPSDATQYVRDSSLWWEYGEYTFAGPVGPAETLECGVQHQEDQGNFNIVGLAHGSYSHRRRVDGGSCDEDPNNVSRSDEDVTPSDSLNYDGFYLNYPGSTGGMGAAAPVYYEFNDQHFIAYWFFYAYNAGGTARSGSEVNPPQIDNHYGDWENITVRLNCGDEPIGVAYYAHGDAHIDDWPGREATPSDPTSSSEVLDVVSGTHPITYSALGTHASYATPGAHPLFDGLGHDYTGPGGAEWITENNLQALSAQPWNGYGGSWGQKLSNSDDPRPNAPLYTYGPEAPHYPDKKSAPADLPDSWYGKCVG